MCNGASDVHAGPWERALLAHDRNLASMRIAPMAAPCAQAYGEDACAALVPLTFELPSQMSDWLAHIKATTLSTKAAAAAATAGDAGEGGSVAGAAGSGASSTWSAGAGASSAGGPGSPQGSTEPANWTATFRSSSSVSSTGPQGSTVAGASGAASGQWAWVEERRQAEAATAGPGALWILKTAQHLGRQNGRNAAKWVGPE